MFSALTWKSSAFISIAVSMPSRVIISSVKQKTPQKAAAPVLTDEAASLPSMSFFMCRPARHMWTVSEATRNGGGDAEDAFPERLVAGLGQQQAGADAQRRPRPRCPSEWPERARAARSSSGRRG